MSVTSHAWSVMGMYLLILVTLGGYAWYGILTSRAWRRRHRHAR